MKYVARIDWQPNDYNERWNEMMARCVEVFGLPGGRYHTYIDTDYMDFIFDHEQDRLLFLTGWPARVPTASEHEQKGKMYEF